MKNRDGTPVRRLARFPRWGLGVLMVATLMGCQMQMVDGHAESKVYDLSGFTGVRASVAVDVEFAQGDSFGVVAHAEYGDFSGLEIEVADGVLIATRPEEVWKRKSVSVRLRGDRRVVEIDGKRVPAYTVRVTAPRIAYLGASVSSKVTAKGIETEKLAIHASSVADVDAEVTGGDVSVDASSNGDVTVSGTYDKLKIEANSSADVTASGTCDKLDINASSNAAVKADGLTCQHGDLRASSAANIEAKVSGGDVSVDASSSGDVSVSGTCGDLDVEANSSAAVKADDLTCQRGKFRASSAADIEAKVSGGDVSVDANSSGDVTLSGTCDKLDINASSSAAVKADGLTCQRGDLRATSGADVAVRLTETVTAHASFGGDIAVRGGATPVKVKELSGGDVSIRD